MKAKTSTLKFRYSKFTQFKASFGDTLQFVVTDDESDLYLEVDVLVNKVIDICNGELIMTYGLIDQRFVDLCLILKHWNKQLFPDRSNRLNSYSLSLMCIAYL